MADEDSERLARILSQTAQRQSAEEERARAAKELAANRQRQLEEAKPRIEACLLQIKASATSVADEVKATGCMLHVFTNEQQSGRVDVTIRVQGKDTGCKSVDGSFTISEMGYVLGADFLGVSPHNGVRVEELTHTKLRSAYLKMIERALNIRPH